MENPSFNPLVSTNPRPVASRVYVGNLSYNVTWMELKDLMRTAGRVLHVTILEDSITGRSRGCAVVEFGRPDDARRAITELTDTVLKGRKIFVREDRETMVTSASSTTAAGSKTAGERNPTSSHGYGGRPASGSAVASRAQPMQRPQQQQRLAIAATLPDIPADSPLTTSVPQPSIGSRVRAATEANRVAIVSNLPPEFAWQEVKDLLRGCGPISRADVICGSDGRNTGHGVVEFSSAEGAANAVTGFHGLLLDGDAGYLSVRLAVENDPVFHAGRGRKLYVGQLAWSVAWQDLKDHFRPLGEVQRCDVVRDLSTGRSKGYGFVEFQDAASAQRAITELNDSLLHDRRIHVREDREER